MLIDDQNFTGTVVEDQTNLLIGDKPWFIEFFAPWCPHCQHLAPIWDKFHNQVKEKVNVARVDCTSQHGRPLCDEFDVRGFPTLLLFPVGQKTYHKYSGDRTVEAFKTWVYSEEWKNVEAQEVGTNKGVIEEWSAMGDAILTSLKDSFLG